MIKRKIFISALVAFFISVFGAGVANAVCPVCTIAVGAGVGLARYFGVDDTVTGTWIGGLMISFIMWTLDWFDRKGINFKGKTIITILAYYGLVVVPLIFMDIIGHPLNRLWGMDKLMLGIIAGSIAFILANMFLYEYVKKMNGGKALFPFQKVVAPIFALIIVSGIFYLITR